MKRILFLVVFNLFIIASATANIHSLNVVGEAEALKGKILVSKGSILAVNETGALSPFKTQTSTVVGTNLISDIQKCKTLNVKADLPLEKGENIAVLKKGDFGSVKNATIAVVKLVSEMEIENDGFDYRPLEIRVYDGKNLITKTKLDFDAYPCALVLDQYTNKENQLAFAWVSVGNGYTTGVTVFNLK